MARHRPGGVGHAEVITKPQAEKMIDGLDLWDLGPVRTPTGASARVEGMSLWLSLSCEATGDPAQRHDRAALRLIACDAGRRWHDLGAVFPPGEAHGSRQWAGSGVLDGMRMWVTYTAVGGTTQDTSRFRQRLFAAEADVELGPQGLSLTGWSNHAELFAPDPKRYDPADDDEGEPGFIKAFRDPFPFRDPATGDEHVLFTASMPPARSATDFNGAIGVARAAPSGWEVLDPLVTADGVNNELERPHVMFRESRYYLFFSTQARTFHPDVPGPTGLYGFVSDHLLGDYSPLNGHGVVFTNPPEEPLQAYSWIVVDDLTVFGFVDTHSVSGIPNGHLDLETVASDRAHFGGTIAPPVRIVLDGDRARIAP